MQTDYAGHDQIYRRYKASRQIGWGNTKDAAENIATLAGAR